MLSAIPTSCQIHYLSNVERTFGTHKGHLKKGKKNDSKLFAMLVEPLELEIDEQLNSISKLSEWKFLHWPIHFVAQIKGNAEKGGGGSVVYC